jgi:hypothetical protein
MSSLSDQGEAARSGAWIRPSPTLPATLTRMLAVWSGDDPGTMLTTANRMGVADVCDGVAVAPFVAFVSVLTVRRWSEKNRDVFSGTNYLEPIQRL